MLTQVSQDVLKMLHSLKTKHPLKRTSSPLLDVSFGGLCEMLGDSSKNNEGEIPKSRCAWLV